MNPRTFGVALDVAFEFAVAFEFVAAACFFFLGGRL
jgi:hypothetical protein